ncbi:hypothetical protein DRP04_03825 [Archaeoglobales archaeon]|nr:MAG: hypothetical protein DRP04_03825 [Archaeoglobales archaeon]
MSAVQFYKEENFKVVEVDGLRLEVPEEWEVVRLGDALVLLRNGLTYRQNKDGDGYPISRIETISDEKIDPNKVGFVNNIKLEELKEYRLKTGDILFSHINSLEHIGKTAIYEGVPELLLHGMNLLLLRPNRSKIEPYYLLNLLRFYRTQRIFRNISKKAVNQASINQTQLKNLKIPLPPLQEQQKIAHVLISIDKAIEAVDEAIEQAECIKKGLMQELLTKGIGHKEFKDTEIGRIPKEWEVVRLESIVEIYDSKRIPLSEQERAKKRGPYPYCGATGIIDYIDDYIFDGEYLLLAEDGGYFGPFEQSAYIMSGKFWVNNHAHILRAKDGVSDNWYLMYALNYMDLRPYIVGSTRTKLNQEHMRKIKILLPPLEEQQKIAEILSKWDEVIELKRAKKERLGRMKKKIMDLLLTGKVRIK